MRAPLSIAILPSALALLCGALYARPAAQPAPTPGAALYHDVGCFQCHGGVGQGGAAGPSLAGTALPYAAFAQRIRQPLREMPPYSTKVLSDAEMRQIHAYVVSLPR